MERRACDDTSSRVIDRERVQTNEKGEMLTLWQADIETLTLCSSDRVASLTPAAWLRLVVSLSACLCFHHSRHIGCGNMGDGRVHRHYHSYIRYEYTHPFVHLLPPGRPRLVLVRERS